MIPSAAKNGDKSESPNHFKLVEAGDSLSRRTPNSDIRHLVIAGLHNAAAACQSVIG